MQDEHVRRLQHFSEPCSLHYPSEGHGTLCPVNTVMEERLSKWEKKYIAVGVCPCDAVRRSKETTCRLMRESTCLHALITMHLSV